MAPELIPVPDPTKLTTDQLYREISSLKELIFARLECMDEALQISTAQLTQQPTVVEKEIVHLEAKLGARMNGMDAIRNEKFLGVQRQFEAMAAAATQHNESAALAISKSESFFIKQIDQMGALIQSESKSADAQKDDMKARLTRIEGQALGKMDTEKVHRDNTGIWIAAAAMLLALLTFIAENHKL